VPWCITPQVIRYPSILVVKERQVVLGEGGVGGHDLEGLNLGLGDDEAVEGVMMAPRQAGQGGG